MACIPNKRKQIRKSLKILMRKMKNPDVVAVIELRCNVSRVTSDIWNHAYTSSHLLTYIPALICRNESRSKLQQQQMKSSRSISTNEIRSSHFLITNDLIIHRNAQPPAPKSLIVSYFLWLVGGWFGIHHIYLGRDIQAFVWWSTFGGYFGMGWLVDFFRMPAMVRDTNEEPAYMAKLVQKWHTQSKPDFSVVRYAFSFLVSYLYAQLILLVIPQEQIGGIDWGFLHWLVPLAGAIGMHDPQTNCLQCTAVALNVVSQMSVYLHRCLFGGQHGPTKGNDTSLLDRRLSRLSHPILCV